jgi:hypothetical protein
MATYRSIRAAGRGLIDGRTAGTFDRVHGLVATGGDDGSSVAVLGGEAINEEVDGGRVSDGSVAAPGGARRYTGGAGSAAGAGSAGAGSAGGTGSAGGGGPVGTSADERDALGSRQPKGRHGDDRGCLKRLHFGV